MGHRLLVLTVLSAIASGLLVFAVGVKGQRAIPAVRCLHEEDATASNRMRRDQALALARAINAAQGQVAEQTRRYAPLAGLGSLPGTPDGFVLRLYSDGDGYVFSIKDDRDPCRYGVFSDQQGFLYESSPTVPLVAS